MKRIITEGQISLAKSLHEDTGDDAHSGGDKIHRLRGGYSIRVS